MKKRQLFLIELQLINTEKGNRKLASGKHHNKSSCTQGAVDANIMGKSIRRNRVFAEFQSMSPRYLFITTGKIKLDSAEI